MGQLVSIYIADGAGGAMRAIEEAEFVEGQGIVGDRYHTWTGTWSQGVRQPKHEVTLIDEHEVTRFNETYRLALRPEEFRRNLVTRDIDLNALVGMEFVVGEVVLKGIKLCEPCEYLAGVTRPEALTGMVHRAGLRAAIVRGGRVNTRNGVSIRRLS